MGELPYRVIGEGIRLDESRVEIAPNLLASVVLTAADRLTVR